ncbi:MAG TPA: exo-beta-N-acetylmuramidase NamZ domain-containing protein, partial [Gemmatimonadaceae bacterium]|nr:exo-beta-N-acetylmuramidase NamZ domain-containing protein [Gemmatimonadaceae bacterium]
MRTIMLVGVMLAGVFESACVHHSASIAAGAPAQVRPGITVLLDDSMALIRGKRIALLTNHTGVDATGASDIDLLRGPRARAAGVTLVRLFAPEHGIRGT